MKWKKPSGKLKEMAMHSYRIDWDDDQDSQFSAEVLAFFEPYWRHHVVYAQVPVAGTKMTYDYVNVTKRLVIEADGEQHFDPKSHWHSGIPAKYLAQIKRDQLKNTLAAKNDFTMIRIRPDDLPLTKAWVEKTFDIVL